MNNQEQQVVNNIKNSGVYNWIKTQFSKINKKTIIDALIIITPLLLIYIYFIGIKTPPEVKETLKNNKQIEKKIDSLKQDNQFIVERMYELEKNQTIFFDLINKNNDLIRENNKELLKLKKIYNEKITSLNGYNISQLDSFFANRYKDYYNK